MQSKLRKRDLMRQLPPGPPLPSFMQLLGTWLRPGMSMVALSRRYGRRVTVNIPFQPPLVMISEPDEINRFSSWRPMWPTPDRAHGCSSRSSGATR